MSFMTKDDKAEMAGPYGLAAAIILMACKDYMTAIRGRNAGRRREVERFFKSSWFGVLCDLDPDLLIKQLKLRAKGSRRF